MAENPSIHQPKKPLFRRIIRVFLKVILGILLFLVIVVILVQTPFVQNILRGKAQNYLAGKLHTRVEIGNIYIGFPHAISLKNIYLEDRQKDTLFSGGVIAVDMDMWKLFHGQVDISRIQLKDLTAKVKRELPDTIFNFQFIADAFASKDSVQKPKAKDTSALQINIGAVFLDNIRLVYKDVNTGNDAELRIGHSEVKLDELNLARQQFSIPLIQLKNTTARIYRTKPLVDILPAVAATVQPAQPANALKLSLSKIEFENINLDYKDAVGALSANMQLGTFTGDIKSIDLQNQVVHLNKLELDKTTAAVDFGKKAKTTLAVKTDTVSASAKGWRVTANTIGLANNNIRFDDDNAAHQPYGMDFSHLKAGFTFAVDDFLFSKDSIAGRVTKGQLTEQSGFELDKLEARFLYAANQAYIDDFELRTPGTVLKQFARLHYPSLAALKKDLSKLDMDIDLSNSQVQLKDVLAFVPALRSQPAFRDPSAILHVNSRIRGNTEKLIIQAFQFSGFGDTKADFSGTVQHATDTKNINADLTIKNISTSKKDITTFAPRGSIPANISVPQQLSLSGKLKGGMKDLFADLVLQSTSGSVMVKGTVQQASNAKAAVYDAQVQTKNLDLGAILQDKETYGTLSADFRAKGKGYDKNTANASFKGVIGSMTYKKYTYRELALDGSIANRQLQATASISDDNIQLNLTAHAGLERKYPSIKINLQIDTLNLFALHLVKDTLQVKGNFAADFTDTNPDSLQGNASIKNIFVTNHLQHYTTDSISLVASHSDTAEDIRLHAEMADIDWSGRYKLSEVAPALQQVINKYYRIKEGADVKIASQNWQMQMILRPSPLVLALMPALKGTDSIAASMTFNSDRHDLRLSVIAPKIKYGTSVVQGTTINASTGGDQLNYRLQTAGINSSGFQLYQTAVYGHITNNELFTSLLLKDEKNKDNYHLSGKLDKLKDGLKFTLDPDSLLLNYEQWQVSRDNFFRYDSSGLVINDFKISSNNQSLQVNSVSASPASPVDVVFSNFSIASLTRFAKQDSLLADGIIDGKVEVKNMMKNPVFTTDLQVKNLSYKRDTIGDLVLKVNNEEANTFAADISVKGNRNDININGKYYTGESRMDMKLDLAQVNLAIIKPFAGESLQDIRGYLKGKLAITGTMAKPVVNGDLHFDSAFIIPSITGEPLKMSNDNIEFDKDGFNFSEFSFLDSANNKATIDGNVYTSDFRDYKFDLTFNASNFRVVNAQQATNKLFYGKLNMDAAANVNGDMSSPRLDGDIRVNKSTDFTLVLPSNDPEVVTRLGVVRFVDKNHPADTLVSQMKLDSFSRNAPVKGMDIALNIETDSSALFTVIIDERSGDALSIRGRSDLSFGMDKSGKLSLTGNYEVESGTYNLSLDVLKRKFNIQRGSTITWTGDPTSAMLNLTATYTANTASIDLVEPELAGRPQSEINKFKQKLPFLVSLKMEGELLKPVITFDISLPENVLTYWPDVDTKLQQVRSDASELNKQVFALLLLNRFVGENPLQSASDGLSAGQMAFQSASQILTNQLNQLAGNLIKGVDINFDLNNQQDYSSGSEQDRTDLNVSVSKKLFNDRIRVNVGSNFELQGPSNPNQNAANIAGDLAIDYQLSKDGRYMVRAYRKNQYELVVEGQVIETGVSFILTLDYNKFREIFGGTRAQRIEARKLAREAKKISTQ